MGYVFLIIVVIAMIFIVVIAYEKHGSTKKKSGGAKHWGLSPAKSKGEQGEAAVTRILGRTIEGERIVFNDFMLHDKRTGMSRQIDHIVVNHRGIFIIETKNYSGRIYGQENEREWRQVLRNETNTFYNPCKQNFTHMIALKQYLPSGAPLFSLIVFVRGDISSIQVENVIPLSALRRELDRDRGVYLNSDEISMYGGRIRDARATDISKEQHIEDIQKMQEKVQNGICPRCGAKLKLRHGKFGDFYGCSRYPKCSFTKDIDENNRKAG